MAGKEARAESVESGAFVKIYDPSVGEQEPWYINDHCFIQAKDGIWHMFGITRQEPARPLEEIHFAHATAKSLLQQPWDKQPFALTAATEAPWHEVHLWAPHVICSSNLYYMFYCAGARDSKKYKIHLATSPDLETWTRSPRNPMVVDGFDARDPFVLRVANQWAMYYCATSKPEGGNHVVAFVTSTDLLTWTNRGVAFTDPSVGTSGGPTESPFVVTRGQSYYLFIGPRGNYDGTDVFVSQDPFHWDIQNKVGHIPAHAAEVVQDNDGQWYVSRAGWGRGGLYLAPLTWNPSDAPAKPAAGSDAGTQSTASQGLKVAVFTDPDGGATAPNCVAATVSILSTNGFEVTKISPAAIRAEGLKGYAVVMFPGGGGTTQAKSLQQAGCAQVERFVARGGGYVGTCAGAFLAGRGYNTETSWLEIVNAQMLDLAHWARGSGQARIHIINPTNAILAGFPEYSIGPLLQWAAPGSGRLHQSTPVRGRGRVCQ